MSTLAIRPTQRHILLVEDDLAQARLFSEILDTHERLRLHTAHDVLQAIEFMTRQRQYHEAPVPDLVVLDLRLPLFSGKVLLEERRRRDFCSKVPIVVLTACEHERTDCLGLGAAGYHCKPPDWPHWRMLVRQLVVRYLGIELQR